MATVTKDFRIKSGLVVEGANATVDGSDIITEDIITGGTQTNIAVTYDAQNKVLNFVAENGIADSTTDHLVEGTTNKYFTDERAQDAVGAMLTGNTQNGISVTYDDATAKINFDVNDPTITISGDVDGSATMTNLGNTEIAVTLDTVNSNVGSFGGQTKIPTFTVDGKGRLTAAGEVDVATNLSIAGDTGTDTVSLLTDTLTFEGGAGIDVAVTSNKVTASIDSTVVTLDGTQALSNKTLGTDLDADANSINNLNTVNTLFLNSQVLDSGSVSTSGLSVGSGLNNIIIADSDPENKIIKFKTNLDMNTQGKVINLLPPSDASDAATKGYVDGVAEGLHIHESVAVAAPGNIDLQGVAPATIDGVSLVDGMRVLLNNQTNPAENGIYFYSEATLLLARAEDYDSPVEIDSGDFVFVTGGATYAATGWVQVNTIGVVGTDPVSFTQFSGAGTYTNGYGLTLTGTEFAVDTAEIATQDDLGNAVDDLTAYVDGFLNSNDGTTVQYIDAQDLATLASANSYTDTAIETGDATATPTYLAIDYNSIAKQVAASSTGDAAQSVVAYSFQATSYRSAKFLVKVAYGPHTEVSEVLVTLDTSDNVAITEYAVVGTNGSASTISADVAGGNVRLLVTPTNDSSTIKVMGTLLV
jgi:hypothetical protein